MSHIESSDALNNFIPPRRSASLVRLYERWATLVSYLQSPVLLLMRLYWGWQFFLTGKGKLMNLDRIAAFFSSLHIPMPKLNAALAGSTECLGGLLLLLGLASRIITVPLIFVLCVAYLTAHIDVTKVIFSDPDKFVTAAPFLFLMCCVIVLVFGPGVFSADYLIVRALSRRRSDLPNLGH
jgi:putative oxidoreductase